MISKNDIDPGLELKLSILKDVPPRNAAIVEKARATFLSQANDLARAVSPAQKQRHNMWMHALQSLLPIYRKEHKPMFGTLTTILLVVSMVLGGGGVTLAAAQSSQPDQPLYGVKLWSEDLRLGMADNNPQSEFQLALNFSNRRAAEIRTIALNGVVPPDSVLTRYTGQIEETIRFAAGLPDEQAIQALKQLQATLQTQLQSFLSLQTSSSPGVDECLDQIRQMLRDRLQLVDEGLQNPAELRLRLRQQENQNSSTPVNQATNIEKTPAGAGNPWTTGTPTPGSGYGPGKGTPVCENCTPANGGQNQNPWTDGTPTPGSGYGPGPGPMSTQQLGNQPTQAGPHSTSAVSGSQNDPGSQPGSKDPETKPKPGSGSGNGKKK
jgi:hypothetical protein